MISNHSISDNTSLLHWLCHINPSRNWTSQQDRTCSLPSDPDLFKMTWFGNHVRFFCSRLQNIPKIGRLGPYLSSALTLQFKCSKIAALVLYCYLCLYSFWSSNGEEILDMCALFSACKFSKFACQRAQILFSALHRFPRRIFALSVQTKIKRKSTEDTYLLLPSAPGIYAGKYYSIFLQINDTVIDVVCGLYVSICFNPKQSEPMSLFLLWLISIS